MVLYISKNFNAKINNFRVKSENIQWEIIRLKSKWQRIGFWKATWFTSNF